MALMPGLRNESSDFRDPVFCNADTMVFTTMSGWLFARNCTRHSATEPLPFGFTSSVPV